MSFIVGDAKYINGIPVGTGVPSNADVLQYDTSTMTWEPGIVTLANNSVTLAKIACESTRGLPVYAGSSFTPTLLAATTDGYVLTSKGATANLVFQQLTWAQIDKTTSDIADITTKSHASLSSIGTNTHTQIDSHLASTSNPHSVTKTQVSLGNVDDVKQMPLSYLDTDDTLAANSNTKVASQNAVKAYVDALSGTVTEVAQDAANSLLSAGSHTGITFTYTDLSNKLDAAVLYGTTVVTACIGNDVRLSDARAPLSHVSTLISDWTEAVQDTVGAFLSGGDCITATYDDAGNVESIGITDNSLTLAKFQHGGSNQLLMYDKDGIPTALSIGQYGLNLLDGQYIDELSARIKETEKELKDMKVDLIKHFWNWMYWDQFSRHTPML